MGIFSDKCEKCGNTVSKRARFCNKCGAPAPRGWWKCPQCGKWIANDSLHCPRCNAPLWPDERTLVAGGVWARESGAYAQRIEIGDAKRLLARGLHIQEGTAAIVMESGEVKAIVEAGRYKPDGLARKLNWFGNPPPRSVVLLDAAEVAVPLEVDGLRTSDGFPVDFYGEAIFRFAGTKEAAKAFVANVLKGERTVSLETLSARALKPIAQAVEELCTTSTLEDLVRDPERRARLQERMETRLGESFAAAGLEVVRVSSADFGGTEYDELERARGEVAAARRRAEQEEALRRLKIKVEEGRLKDEGELAAYKETLDAEWRIASAERTREWERLKAGWAHDDALSALARKAEEEEARREADEVERRRRHEAETDETRHRIELERMTGEHERSEKVADAKTDAEKAAIAADEEMREAKEWLEVKARKEAIRRSGKAEDASRRKGMGVMEMLADVDDPAAREALLEAAKLQMQAGKTPEQLLAERALDAANAAANRPGDTIVK